MLPAIGATMPGKPAPTALFPAWDATVVNASGGLRPGAVNALPYYWDSFGFGDPPANSVPFLFGVYPGTTAGTIGIARGNVTDNTDTVYRTSFDPTAPLSPFEQQLNATALRVSAAPPAAATGSTGIPGRRRDAGGAGADPARPRRPVRAVLMEQVYARAGRGERVAATCWCSGRSATWSTAASPSRS